MRKFLRRPSKRDKEDFRVVMDAWACAGAGIKTTDLRKEKRKKRKTWALFMCDGAIKCVTTDEHES